MSLLKNPEPCPFGVEDPLACPRGRHVLDHNRISGWRYECQRLQAPCPAYKQAATREELARKMFANLKG